MVWLEATVGLLIWGGILLASEVVSSRSKRVEQSATLVNEAETWLSQQ